MYDKLPSLLETILTISKSSEEKQKFIQEFQQLCRQYAVLDLVQKLPENQQEQLRQQLIGVAPEAGKQIILSHFSPEQYKKTLDATSEKLFKEYIADTLSTLSQTTKQALQTYLNPYSMN